MAAVAGPAAGTEARERLAAEIGTAAAAKARARSDVMVPFSLISIYGSAESSTIEIKHADSEESACAQLTDPLRLP